MLMLHVVLKLIDLFFWHLNKQHLVETCNLTGFGKGFYVFFLWKCHPKVVQGVKLREENPVKTG